MSNPKSSGYLPENLSSQNPACKIGLTLLAVTLLLALLLAACGEEPVDRKAEIDRALALSGAQTFPTVNPTVRARDALGFSIAIFGLRDYYPQQQDEKIEVNLINYLDTSIYMSQLCHMMLQRQEGQNWVDIAYGRPCPPNDTVSYRLFPHTSVDSPFVFAQTRPLPGQSWEIEGTYRLLLTYYLRCQDAYSMISACEDKQTAQSDWFQLKKF